MLNDEIIKYLNSDNDTDISLIVEVIGAENALKLIENFGGGSLYIPIIKNVEISVRNSRILSDYKSGLSYRTLSNKYGLSERYIRTIIGGEK